jgi:hypothetical protein
MTGNMSSKTFHNYYEKLVLEHILSIEMDKADDPEYIATLACVALNHLPPRYMPRNVDLTLYMSPKESQEIELKVSRAVKNAILLVNRRHSMQTD